MRIHLSRHRLTPDRLVLDPPAFRGFLFGVFMHYYQHHIGDFIKDTARLNDSQAMAYLRLIWMYYDQEKALKPDTKILAFQIGASIEDTQLLLEAYFIETPSGWMHSRCEAEIAEYRAYLEKKSNAGRASAERRKNVRSTDVEQVLNSSSTDVQLTTNHKPLTTNHKPKDTEPAAPVSQSKPAKPARKSPIPEDFSISQRVKDWAKQKGYDRLEDHLDAFTRKAKMNAYMYVDWDLAFMEAIREDWAKIRGKPTFAQQAADIARTTVPSTAPNRDPVLLQLEEDFKKATPMPSNIREMMKGAVKRI
jgi:uncharacterized protein YdaU (DUF1376 family)